MRHQRGRKTGLGRAARGALAVAALLACVAVPAQLAPQAALAAGGGHAHDSGGSGSGDGKGESSGSGSGSGGSSSGGIGSRLKSTACGELGSIPFVGGGLQGAICPSGGSGGGGVDPVQATSSILKKMFGGLGVAAGLLLSGALTRIPNFASQSGGVVALEHSTTAVGFGILALVLTLSVMRFALAGISGSGGFEAVEGVTRTLVAALAMVAWPWAFSNLAALMNSVTHAMLSTHAVHVALLAMVGLGAVAAILFGTGVKVGWVFGIVILGLEAILIIGLLLMKVLLADATTVIFVAMPLALTLWPLRETAWIAGRVAHVLFVAMATPLMWAIIFATAAVMGGSVLSVSGGAVSAVLIRPVAAMSMFIVALWAPMMLMRHAHGGVGRPLGRIGGYMGMRLATNAVAAHLPERMGGRRHEAETPVPRLELSRDLSSGSMSASQRLSVPVNGEGAGLGAFLAPVAAMGEELPGVGVGNGHSGHEAEEATALMEQAKPAGGARGTSRPAQDVETFDLRDPRELSFAESLDAARLKLRAQQAPGGVPAGRAALEAFSPPMLERIGGVGQSPGGFDGSSFRDTMAATALSGGVSERQAGALETLAGMGDGELGELLAGASVPRPAAAALPLTPAGAPGSFRAELDAARRAVPVAEQPPPPTTSREG